MSVVLGLIILVAAVVVGVAGVFDNVGSGHALTHGFSLFGYHLTGSTGALFLYGTWSGRPACSGWPCCWPVRVGPHAAAAAHAAR
jgi:hypothetical protein